MKQIEQNLLVTATILTDEAEYMLKLMYEQPESKYFLSRRISALKQIASAEGFIKALKMVSCDHNTKKGHTTGIAWVKDLNDNREVINSYKEITKRCHNCNQVFYRKRYNLRKKKSNLIYKNTGKYRI